MEEPQILLTSHNDNSSVEIVALPWRIISKFCLNSTSTVKIIRISVELYRADILEFVTNHLLFEFNYHFLFWKSNRYSQLKGFLSKKRKSAKASSEVSNSFVLKWRDASALVFLW